MEQLAPDKDGTTRSFEDDGTMPNNSATQAGDEQLQNENISASRFGIPSSQTIPNDMVKTEADLPEVEPTVSDVGAITSTSNGEFVNDKAAVNERQPTSLSPTAGVEIDSKDHPDDTSQNIMSRDVDVSLTD